MRKPPQNFHPYYYRLLWGALALIILNSTGQLSAAIRPSLDIAFCTWNATDILVLAPILKPGEYRVVEAIKGETQPGTILVLEDLAPPPGIASPLSQLISRIPFEGEPFVDAPPMRDIDRLFVFLRRPGALPEYNTRPDLPVSTVGWQPADLQGLRTSTVWLQDGVAYGFRQTMNPGPSHLVPLWSEPGKLWGEPELRNAINSGIRQRQEFDKALGNPDGAARAKELANFLKSGHGVPRQSALRHLGSGGHDAAVVLQELLADETQMPQYPELLDALLKTGVHTFDFKRVMQREKAYWAAKCPLLQAGWWVDTSDWPALEEPRSHYLRVLAALEAIHKLHLKEAFSFVLAFSGVWNMCPPLGSREPLERSQVSEELRFLLSPNFR